MQHPPEITYKGVQKTADIEALVQKQVAKLDKVAKNIISAHISIEQEASRHQTGNPFRVRIYTTVPGGYEMAVKRVSVLSRQFEPLPTVINRAFDSAQRQLERLAERQRGEVKSHPENQVMAFVDRLFRDQDYGFIKSIDGQDIYFHKNSCMHGEWDKMEVGTGVRYVEHVGEKGLQASSVEIVDKLGAREMHGDLHELEAVTEAKK